jgi:hypothetical protein
VIVVCAGLYGSGSTWLFNAVAEILRRKCTVDSIDSFYADDLTEEATTKVNAKIIVVKSHSPNATMVQFIEQSESKVLLSTRDPRDCVASIMQRFWMPFEQSLKLVKESGTALLRLHERCKPLVLRYEDGFTEEIDGLRSIADHVLGAVDEDTVAAVAHQLRPEAVKAKIDELITQGVFDGAAPSAQFEPKTHWHPRHVGDLRTGKFLDVMTRSEAADILVETAPFCRRFRYPSAISTSNPDTL